MQIETSTIVARNPEKVYRWFLDLKTHSEWYRFGTHEGFEVTKGQVDQPGGIFETRERIGPFKFHFVFRTVGTVENRKFIFELLRPFGWKKILSEFEIRPLAETKTQLFLRVYTQPRFFLENLADLIVFSPLTKVFVKRQITAEVRHIKSQIEPRPW